MKTKHFTTLAGFCGAVAAVALLAATLGTARAADSFPVKGATLLMKPVAPTSAHLQPAMSCPTCKDQLVVRKDLSARGAFKPDVLVVRHLCQGCSTTLSTVGHGKAAHTQAVHQCSLGNASNRDGCN